MLCHPWVGGLSEELQSLGGQQGLKEGPGLRNLVGLSV